MNISISITKADGSVASYDGEDAAEAAQVIDAGAGAQAASVSCSAETPSGEGRIYSRHTTATNDGQDAVTQTLRDAAAWIAEVGGA